MKRSDAILGGGAALLGVAVFINSMSFPKMDDGTPGPSLFPQILAVLLVAFGVTIVFQSMRPHTKVDRNYTTLSILKAGGVLLAIAAYILVVQKVGFLITATLILLGLMLMLGARLRVSLPAAVAIALFSLILFEKVLRVPLPPGLLGV